MTIERASKYKPIDLDWYAVECLRFGRKIGNMQFSVDVSDIEVANVQVTRDCGVSRLPFGIIHLPESLDLSTAITSSREIVRIGLDNVTPLAENEEELVDQWLSSAVGILIRATPAIYSSQHFFLIDERRRATAA